MITITTEKQTIYINVVITLLKVLTFLCAFSGVIWIIGTAGQSDLDLITFSEIITRVLQGFFLCGVAWVLNFIKLAIE